MEDDSKQLLKLKYLQIWHSPSMFALGITVDTDNFFINFSIGTLQIVFGCFQK